MVTIRSSSPDWERELHALTAHFKTHGVRCSTIFNADLRLDEDTLFLGTFNLPVARPMVSADGCRFVRVSILAPPDSKQYRYSVDEFERSAAIAVHYLSRVPYLVPPLRFLTRPGKDIARAVRTLSADDRLYLDIETDMLDAERGKVICLGIAVNDLMPVIAREDLPEALTAIAACKARLICCGSKFELKWLWSKCGQAPAHVEDVQVDRALLQEGSHVGLEFLAGLVDAFGYELAMTEFLDPIPAGKHVLAPVRQRRQHHQAPVELLERYNATDVRILQAVHVHTSKLLQQEPHAQERVRDWLNRAQVCMARTERNGFALDPALVLRKHAEYRRAVESHTQFICAEAAKHGMPSFNVRSNAQKAELLYDRLKLPAPVHQTDDDEGEACRHVAHRSVAFAVLDALRRKRPNPILTALCELAERQSMLDGLLTRSMETVQSGKRLVHTTLDITKLVTGQVSSTNPPMQNVRSDLRCLFSSRFAGGRIMEVDYSQLHLRIIGNLAQCEGFIDAYRSNADLHARTAAAVLMQIPEEQFVAGLRAGDSDCVQARELAKRINFSTIFEITASGLAELTQLTVSASTQIIKRFFAVYPEIAEHIERQHAYAEQYGYVISPTGRVRHLPGARSADRTIQARALRQASDFAVSNSGRYTMLYGMTLLDEALIRYGMRTLIVLQVHDSIDLDVAPGELEIVPELVRDCCIVALHREFPWMQPIPLRMEGFHNDHWEKESSVRFALK